MLTKYHTSAILSKIIHSQKTSNMKNLIKFIKFVVAIALLLGIFWASAHGYIILLIIFIYLLATCLTEETSDDQSSFDKKTGLNKLQQKLFPTWKKCRETVFPYVDSASNEQFISFENWGSNSRMPHIIAPLWQKIRNEQPALSNLSEHTAKGVYGLCERSLGPTVEGPYIGTFDFNGNTYGYKLLISHPGKEPCVDLTISSPLIELHLTCQKWDLEYRGRDGFDDCFFTLSIDKKATKEKFEICYYSIEYQGPTFFGSFHEYRKGSSIKTCWWRTHYDKFDWWYPKGDNTKELEQFWPFVRVFQSQFLEPIGLTCLTS